MKKIKNKTYHFLAYNDPEKIYIMFGLVFRHKIKKGIFLNFRALLITLFKYTGREDKTAITSIADKFQCQPTALLRASVSMQGGQMALSVIYFQITHHLGRPHYVWDEYLYSVLVLCGMMMKGREMVKPGAGSQPALLESTKGTTRLNIPIRQTNCYQQYYMPSQHTYGRRVLEFNPGL